MENKEPMSFGKSKSKFLLLASTLFVLLVILLILVLVNNRATPPSDMANNQAPTGVMVPTDRGVQQTVNNSTRMAATAPPQVMVGSWLGIKTPASVPTLASVYSLKTNVSYDEAKAFAQQLDIRGDIQKNNNVVIAYSAPIGNTQDASVLVYNLSTTTFIYNSSKGLSLPAGTSTELKATQLLKNIGVYDTTLTAVESYKDKSKPGITFYEFHRDWEKVGLPILNAVGLLNVPENQPLSKLALSSKNAGGETDANIYATSDKTDGFSRTDDFNTITVGIDDQAQAATYVKSSLRQLETAAPSNTSLITFDEAVSLLKNGQSEYVLTTPSGNGSEVPWNKIYPMNRAEAQTATVTDSVVVYLEKPATASQTALTPYYVFRATAKLDSGYNAVILAAVPAWKKSSAKGLLSFAGDVSAQDTNGQQQGSIDFTPIPTVNSANNPGSTNNTPGTATTIAPGTPAGTDCHPAASELNPVYNIGGLTYGWTNFRNDTGATKKEGFWYYIPTEDSASVMTNLSQILSTLGSGGGAATGTGTGTGPGSSVTEPTGTINHKDSQQQQTFGASPVPVTQIPTVEVTLSQLQVRKINKVVKDVARFGDYCPIRVSGSSPTVFIYGQAGTQVELTSGADISYADPVASSAGTWNVELAQNNKLLVNGSTRDWIYYEYENASFNRPAFGWNVSRNSLDTLAKNVAKELGLNAKETERAVYEVRHAASSVNGNNLFVGVISADEVQSKLPLSVSGNFAVERVYFYVGSANGNTVVAPQLSKLSRSASQVVELGSYSEK